MTIRFHLSGALNRVIKTAGEYLALQSLPTNFNGRWVRLPLSIWNRFRCEYEPYIATVLDGNLQNGDVFIDVGAQYGLWSLYGAALVGTSGCVISCEPSPVYQVLSKSAQLYEWIKPLNIGVGAFDGEEYFFAQGYAGSSSFLQEITEINFHHQSHVPITRHLVQFRKLDTVIRELDIVPSVIKIDVEGFEYEVLKGAQETLARHSCTWIIEVHPPQLRLTRSSEDELKEMLSVNGYSIRLLDKNPYSISTIVAEK